MTVRAILFSVGLAVDFTDNLERKVCIVFFSFFRSLVDELLC